MHHLQFSPANGDVVPYFSRSEVYLNNSVFIKLTSSPKAGQPLWNRKRCAEMLFLWRQQRQNNRQGWGITSVVPETSYELVINGIKQVAIKTVSGIVSIAIIKIVNGLFSIMLTMLGKRVNGRTESRFPPLLIGKDSVRSQNNVIRTNYVKAKVDNMQQNSMCKLCDDWEEKVNPMSKFSHIVPKHTRIRD